MTWRSACLCSWVRVWNRSPKILVVTQFATVALRNDDFTVRYSSNADLLSAGTDTLHQLVFQGKVLYFASFGAGLTSFDLGPRMVSYFAHFFRVDISWFWDAM